MNRTYLLGAVLALALLPANVVAAAIPLLRAEWQTGAFEMGWVFAAYQLGYVLSVLVLLPLTDRIKIGYVIAACLVLTVFSFLLFPYLAHGIWSASALRFMAGLGLAGIYMPGVRVVAATASPHRRGIIVGSYVSAFYLGSALSLGASGWLLPAFGWRGATLILSIVAALALPLAIYSTFHMAAPARGSARLDPQLLRNGSVMRTVLAYTGHSWELYVSRGWLAAFVAAILLSQGSDTVTASSQGSQWAALMSACGTPGVFLGGWLSDRIGRATAALIITVLSGSISLFFGFLGGASLLLVVIVGCIYGLLVSADSPIYSTAITELAPVGRLGSAQAVQSFFGFGATILAPVAAGIVLDLNLGWSAVFMLAGVTGMLLGLPLIVQMRQPVIK